MKSSLKFKDYLEKELKDLEFKKVFDKEYKKLDTLARKEKGEEKRVTKRFINSLKKEPAERKKKHFPKN